MPKKLTAEEFITKARAVHGDKYDYSLVEYTGKGEYVTIICPIHGPFEQIANNRMRGKGCPKCKHKRLTREEWIAEFKKVHGDKYDYSKMSYIDHLTPICIVCPIHGDFWQTPNNHIRKHGCDECGRIKTTEAKTLTSAQFITKAKNVHGDKYNYSLVEYKNNRTKVKIICPEHGVFEQLPDNHLQGKEGCRKCLKQSQSDKIYLLMDSEYKATRMKIGITNNLARRLRELKHGRGLSRLQPTPFEIFKKACYKVGPGKAYEIEQMFHRYYASRNLGYTGFDGATEWFEYDENAEKILGMIADLINAKSYNKK